MTGRDDRALVIEAPGVAAIRAVPYTDGEILVRTRWSGISAGTELASCPAPTRGCTPRSTPSSACSAATGPGPGTR